MHPDKFGDSYDIVKRSLLKWLSACGTWAAHPMFTSSVCTSFAEEFSSFLEARLVTTSPIPKQPERESYFESAIEWCSTDHLFFDPDTGVSLSQNYGREHLALGELVKIANGRCGKLVLVFDQSFSRSSVDDRMRRTKEKLACLEKYGVYGLVYCSHANFILASSDETALSDAETILREASRLPSKRFITYRDL